MDILLRALLVLRFCCYYALADGTHLNVLVVFSGREEAPPLSLLILLIKFKKRGRVTYN